MSLYREAGRRGTTALLGGLLAGLLIGVLAGYLLGSAGGDEEASLEDAVEQLQEDVTPALSELELVTIEYSEAVRGGEVVAETEYAASVDHVERARSTFEDASAELRTLSPDQLASAEQALAELATLVEQRAPAGEVKATAGQADAAIRGAARITTSAPPAGG
ncbi:MAG: hypothetical protein ACRDL6_05180 [Solirubrobacterales bacterium]